MLGEIGGTAVIEYYVDFKARMRMCICKDPVGAVVAQRSSRTKKSFGKD